MRHPTNSRDSSDNKRKREDSDRSNEQQYEMRDRDIYFNKEGIYWFLNETLVEKYDSGDMPSMTKHPNQTRDYIFNFAKDAFESEDKAIKALQVSFYILIHDREDAIKSHIARNLLKTLFQRGVLLNDDFSINEDKLAICQDKGRNFSYILLSNGKLNAIKFLKDFMTDQLFSDSEDEDKKIKKKIIESMIYSMPFERMYDDDRIRITDDKIGSFEIAIDLISEENRESFCVNIFKHFAISQAKNIYAHNYIDAIIIGIKRHIPKENRGDAIEKIFFHSESSEHPIKQASVAGNKEFVGKVQNLIEEAFQGKEVDKKAFISKLELEHGFKFEAPSGSIRQYREKWGRQNRERW